MHSPCGCLLLVLGATSFLPSPSHALAPVYRRAAFVRAQTKDKARKDFEKALKVREPLIKKLAEDPEALAKMRAELEDLRQQLGSLGL